MNFFIQVSNPIYLTNTNNVNNIFLSEAIEDIFELNAENAFLSWNHIYVPLSYKYDISYMIEDIIKLLNAIQNMEKGNLIIHWLPDTFRCDWQIEWNANIIYIKSYWYCTVGHLEILLNNKNSIHMFTVNFLNEWKKLIEILINGLKNNGYNEINLKGMGELINIYEKINDVGIIYK